MQIHCTQCQYSGEIEPSATGTIVCPGCGSSIFNQSGTTIGWKPSDGQRRLGRFELRSAVGSGAFGTVYEAHDTQLDRTVAIKVPRSDLLSGAQGETERFLREARSVAQFSHPSIISIHDVGEQDGVPYLVEDLVRGITLTDLLSSERLPSRQVAEMVAQVADALQYAHDRGVIHRDIKPSNIMLERDKQGEYVPKLMDFGLAKRDMGETTLTIEGQILGTPAYMSPEQARGDSHRVDGRSDVYSIGAVLYQLLTGQLPFKGNPRMLLHHVLHDEPKPPRKIDAKIPPDLETICLRAMAKEPNHRYPSAGAFRDDLRRWLSGQPIQARPVGRLERMVKWARRRPDTAALLAVIIVLVVSGLAGGIWLWQGAAAPIEESRDVAPVVEVKANDVDRLVEALLKPLLKIEYTLPENAPAHLDRKFIPLDLLQLPSGNGSKRHHDGPLYFLLSGSGKGHTLDLTDQPGQGGQIGDFSGEITVNGPYWMFLANLVSTSRIYIKGGPGYSILAPLDGGLGSKHVEFDGTHLLMPINNPPAATISDTTEAEKAALRNPDLIQKVAWKYFATEYTIFCRPATKIVPGDQVQRQAEFPQIHEMIQLDHRRQIKAPTIRSFQLERARRNMGLDQ